MLKPRVFLVFTLCAAWLGAEQKVELVAKSVVSEGDVATAVGDAVAVWDGYFLRADKLIYDKNGSKIEAFGDIFILKDSSTYTLSDYAIFYTDIKQSSFDKFFLMESGQNLWVSSKKANSKDGVYTVKNGVSSSCDPLYPDWRLEYKEGNYNSTTKFMTLHGAKLLLSDIPVFYTPYFAFSADKTRRSGLLRPDIGIRGDEGFIFVQPIYFVPRADSNWDVEFLPQIRTKRGEGISSILRFADSEYSKGFVKIGYFKDFVSFANKYDLKYDSHYGLKVFYDRSRLLAAPTEGGREDGFYTDINYLNDIDYLNLNIKDHLRENRVDKIQSSKINYYYQTQNDYIGTYLKYYIDTSKIKNDDTLQELPKLQYHRFMNRLGEKILYSIDVTSNRYHRKEGLSALSNTVFIPIGYNTSFFDDFLGFGFGEHLYFSKSSFFGNKNGLSVDDYYYHSNTHKVRVYTNLQKRFKEFTHTIDASLTYSRPGLKSEKNYPSSLSKDELVSLVTLSEERENSTLSLAQFFYNSKGDLFLSHRISQAIYHDSSRIGYRYGDTQNEIIANLTPYLHISNELFFSHKEHKLSFFATTIGYDDMTNNVSVSHVYRDRYLLGVYERGNYVTLNAARKVGDGYSIFGGYEYDIDMGENRAWSLGFLKSKKCINYSISIKKEPTPILTSASSNSIKNHIIYFSINLIPLGGLSQTYSITSKD